MTETITLAVETGLDATDEYLAFLEEFFANINEKAARSYDYTTVRVDGELVGVAAVSHPDDATYAKLAFLRVDDAHRRKGVATRLIDTISRETERDELLAKAYVGWQDANRYYRVTGWEHDPKRSTGILNAYIRDCP